MEYAVGTQYRFKNNDFGNPEIITPEVSKHVPESKIESKSYIPGTKILFIKWIPSISILTIVPAR